VSDPAEFRSALFAFASEYVDRHAALDPLFATQAGYPQYDHLLPDFSDESMARQERLLREALIELDGIETLDGIDDLGKALMLERLTSTEVLFRTGEFRRTFGILYSPLTEVRQVFELMPALSAQDAAVIGARLRQVRVSMASWRDGLEAAVSSGRLPPRRHILNVAGQAELYGRGAYTTFAERVAAATGVEPAELLAAARDADAACGELGAWLRDVLAPTVDVADGCGEERYRTWAGYWTGTTLDPAELYEWGWEDLRRINRRMWELAAQLAPGATRLVDVATVLDADESRWIEGTDQLLRRLEEFTAATVEALDGVHFDIDERIRTCAARLAPEGTAAAPYYIPPSEDLSRPGTTWYPTLGNSRFSWWRIASTWYHESVPGHHLQCGVSILERERQSRFHRLEGWTSGYGEGWALYAERLMLELGGFSDPGDELGYLCGQAMRAARVVVDLGLHLGLDAPGDLGTLGELGDCSGRRWTAPMAVALLEEWALEEHEFAVSEVERYLSLPGQAISYKVGERAWLRAREEARGRLGEAFELKRFHSHALALGPMGLDTFAAAMAGWDGQ
jgi:uncharacterized protein (DUF885 family)